MDSFTSMKQKLLPLNLYSVSDNSNLNAELLAYAEGLDILFNDLDTMLREYYISTAQSYGITEREKLVGAERSEYSITKRREMLKNREQTLGLSCTPNAFFMMLKSYGLSDFIITEKFAQQEVVITVYDSLSNEIKSWINERVEADFPSHLKISVVYSKR